MPLAERIAELRDRALASLDDAHDYYFDSKTAWRLLQQDVRDGRHIDIVNPETGTAKTGVELAARAQAYVENLTSSTLQQFASVFEDFFFDTYFGEYLTALLVARFSGGKTRAG